MDLKNIFVRLISNYEDFDAGENVKEVIAKTGEKFYLTFVIPTGMDEDKAKKLIDDLRNKLVGDEDIKFMLNNGVVSLEDMDEYLKNVLTKTACQNKEEDMDCNISYETYNEFDFDTINPSSSPRRNYTKNEISDIKSKFKEKCNTDGGEEVTCCDPFDTTLKSKMSKIPKYILDNFKKIDVEKCNSKIEKIKVCNDDDCGEGNWKKPTPYEFCKLMNLKPNDYNLKQNISTDLLTADCYYSKCNNSGIFLRIDQNYNDDEKINNHYYLIVAIKRDDVDHLKEYYEIDNNGVNEKLLYGYSGNTSFHNAIYYNAFKCIEYLLTTNYEYSNVNKDNNSVLHIACLRGNYDVVFKLLKHGCKVECTNKFGDTALHSAVRSGSYNCVKILLQNNGISCISKENIYGEIPLHTAVIPVRYDEESDLEKKKEFKDRMNYNIVKLLIDYGSDIHSKNKDGDIILKTLSNKDMSLVREQIRTYIQRKYYDKYPSEEYNKYLKDFTEVRPFELITKVDEKLKDTHSDYDDDIDYKNIIEYDDTLRNEELYVKKNTRGLKDFPKNVDYSTKETKQTNSVEYFSNDSNDLNDLNDLNDSTTKYGNILAIIILIIIVLYILMK
jgi:ankyrin repeat protein